jgi:recombination associated protein RdgC
MFKKATIIGFNPKAMATLTVPQEQLFAPLLSSEVSRSGWSAVRDDELVYIGHNKQVLMHFTIEKKILPASVVNQVAKAKAAELEEQQGFPPGKKAMKDLKERVFDELLPRAFTTTSVTRVWIDREAGRIVIENTAGSVLDLIQRALYKTFGELQLQDIAWPRAKVLTSWLDQGEPEHFTLDDAVTLQYPNAQRKVVKFAKANLAAEDVRGHVAAGAVVQAVAMTYNSRISFTITDNMQLRGIKPLDILRESAGTPDADKFDNDFTLMTGELSLLFTALAEAA